MYLILSLDGGGIRGALTAKLLERLDEARPFLEKVDLFAGTSTGGILALGLAKGLSPAAVLTLYLKQGRSIFGRRSVVDALVGPLDELVRASYDNAHLSQALDAVFGATTLGELGRKVLIATFDLGGSSTSTWSPRFLHNYDSPGNDRHVRVVDAALRTSAAPTYFPSYQGSIDGGVVANNPATCAVAKAVRAGVALEEIFLLSLGTGFNPHTIAGDRHDWGLSQWVKDRRLINVIMDGMPGVADYQCTWLLGERYHRLDVDLPRVVDLDAAQDAEWLVGLAQTVDLTDTLAWLARR
jgi:patatin-like phospholipase/acyl hydrolase